MKLIGIEFEEFACFDRVFVPFRPGLNILVGRNNSGKTALLRGLTALDGLMFKDRRELDAQLAGYCRSRETPPAFGLHVWAESEPTDPELLQCPAGEWPHFVSTNKPQLDFLFRIWPLGNAAPLERCEFTYSGQPLALLERREDGRTLRTVYDLGGNAVQSQVVEGIESPGAPDGKSWKIFARNQTPLGFPQVGRTVRIEAHRSVSSDLGLQSQTVLPANAATLAQFLQTLQGGDRPKFEQIEQLVVKVFAEFKYVNPESADNRVWLSFTLRGSGHKVPLSHCGTGVEQILSLATFVITSPPGAVILLDEPHSYLHPTAERNLIDFLLEHSEHHYFIATHSAVLINSVPADSIIHIDPKRPARPCNGGNELGGILRSLGYKNSDFLFHDRFIGVEGQSDQDILPILLKASKEFSQSDIERTGFIETGGSERRRAGRQQQTSILRCEKILERLGRSSIPRLYLRDGDASPGDRALLLGTTPASTGKPVKIKFLPRTEIENYLLVPKAIVEAMRQQATLDGQNLSSVSVEAIAEELAALCGSNDSKLIKASEVLARLFEEHALSYDKRRSGTLIAQHITRENQSSLQEIVELVQELFRVSGGDEVVSIRQAAGAG